MSDLQSNNSGSTNPTSSLNFNVRGDDRNFTILFRRVEELEKKAFDFETNENKSAIDLGLDYRFENGLGLKVGKTLTNGFWFAGIRYSITPGSIAKLIF